MTTTRKRETLTVDVRGLLDDIRKISGGPPGPWVRSLIEQALNAPPRPSTRVSARRSRTDGAKVTLWLQTDEHQALVQGALKDRLSQSEFVGRLAKGYDTSSSSAFIGHDALKCLAESNLQLVKIGVNLNQIAHALNALALGAPGEFSARDRGRIEAAAQAALDHVEQVSSLIDSLAVTRRVEGRRRRSQHADDHQDARRTSR
jgi:hypothetical protein